MSKEKISIFWFRRDLRLTDNTALHHALKSDIPVLPIFIFDQNILEELPIRDARITFIHKSLEAIYKELIKKGSSLLCLQGDPLEIWAGLIEKYDIVEVYTNRDYEPYALNRDESIKNIIESKGIKLNTYKDQVIFEPDVILKADGKPYTIYTPYKNKWLTQYAINPIISALNFNPSNFHKAIYPLPTISDIGFEYSSKKVKPIDLSMLTTYAEARDFPKHETSNLSPHLRFGTVSIRQVLSQLEPSHQTFLSELIWREFFIQILFHFPSVVNHSFKSKYDNIVWRNNKEEFELWCKGKTGYPMVDAGMRQLNVTGYMHNRVRMITASFLCKHLLIDWRWGEAYFAQKLLDYELASNNGNWQWSAGTGCDAAPYFRIFNPTEQLKKFGKDLEYVKKWVPEYGQLEYPKPMVDHKLARIRALETYKTGLSKTH